MDFVRWTARNWDREIRRIDVAYCTLWPRADSTHLMDSLSILRRLSGNSTRRRAVMPTLLTREDIHCTGDPPQYEFRAEAVARRLTVDIDSLLLVTPLRSDFRTTGFLDTPAPLMEDSTLGVIRVPIGSVFDQIYAMSPDRVPGAGELFYMIRGHLLDMGVPLSVVGPIVLDLTAADIDRRADRQIEAHRHMVNAYERADDHLDAQIRRSTTRPSAHTNLVAASCADRCYAALSSAAFHQMSVNIRYDDVCERNLSRRFRLFGLYIARLRSRVWTFQRDAIVSAVTDIIATYRATGAKGAPRQP